MAYMNQDKKRELAPAVKKVLKKYGVKGTLAVRHHSTLVVNLKSGKVNFGIDRAQVNPYWIKEHWEGDAQSFLMELKDAMMTGNHDRSDIQTDLVDVGWYIDINIGKWDKPYQVEAQ